MKALTIWQPWASLIIAGAKPYEFRSWAPPAWPMLDIQPLAPIEPCKGLQGLWNWTQC